MNRYTILVVAVASAALMAFPAGAAELKIYPPQIRVEAGMAQTILVTSVDAQGVMSDVSGSVSFKVANGTVARFDKGAVSGLAPGTAELVVSFQDQRMVAPIAVAEASRHELSFVNDIVPIFTRASCAQSTCHGSVRGQHGFKLSLFGSDPALDYEAITKLSEGRRINREDPAKSLVLLKPTFQVPHGGGLRFKTDSLEYRSMLQWLKTGAAFDKPGQPRLEKLNVYPPTWVMTGLGTKVQLIATGTYSDGSTRDLTNSVRYSSNISTIADVAASGILKAESPGETAVMVRTMGKASAVPLIVVKDRPMANYPKVARNNYIDDFVFKKLRQVNVVPSDLSTDNEFLRRVFMDVIGLAPTIDEARSFLDSPDPDKRTKLIDQLLERPERGDVWGMRFADMFRAGYNVSGQKGGGGYTRWFRDRIRRNTPWDAMVRDLLVSQGRHDFEGTSNFYFVSREMEPEECGVNVAQVLLGTQIECARCHNHPFEKWSQNDFYAFSAFFARMGLKQIYQNNHKATFLKEDGEVIQPKTKQVMVPKYLDGKEEPEQPGEDVREKLAVWVTSPSNPFFAKATVNRFWKFFMGRGLVEAVDDFRVTNPASNEALLQALADDFIEHGFNIKYLERRILTSRAYQLSSVPNETNESDQINYSHFIVRRLMAESILDTMTQVTGIPEKLPTIPLGVRAMTVPVLPNKKPQYMMKVFGRIDLREVICERDTKPSVAQVMDLISGDTVDHQTHGAGGRLEEWLADSSISDTQLIERFYLAALSRRPEVDETQAVVQLIAKNPGQRRQVFEDMLWMLFNSKEFLFQH